MVVPLTQPGDLAHFMAVQHIAMQNVAAPGLDSLSAYRDYEIYDNVPAGSTRRDGTIEYETDLVGKPLEQLLDDVRNHRVLDPRDRGDRADLVRYKRALFTVMQENADLLVPAGKTYTGESDRPGRQLMQRVLTDKWCLRNADRYIEQFDLGPVTDALREIDLNELAQTDRDFADELAPGMDAADRLTDRLAERSGLDPGDVLDRLNQQDADGKVAVIAGCLLNVEPDHVTEEQAKRIGAVVDHEFAAIRVGQGDGQGRALLGRLDHAVAEQQTMSVGLLPPATGTPTVAVSRPVTGARTTDPRGVVRGP